MNSTMHYNTALLVGRFQPFHNGHLYLIKKALLSADKIIIGIGSANVTDENNPYSVTLRQQMIEKVICQEKLIDKLEQIILLDDFHNDKKWLEQIQNKSAKFDLVVGNNEWVNRILEKAGYPILRVGYYKRYQYEGEKIRQLMKEKKNWQDRVPSYLISICRDVINHVSTAIHQYKHLVIGGTFDRLHKGHQAFIRQAFTFSQTVVIGLVNNIFSKQKQFEETIQPYNDRFSALKQFLEASGYSNRYEIIPINDIYGTTLTNKKLEAILVTAETQSNAVVINKYRCKNKLPELKIELMPLIKSEDKKIIRSQRIRFGEIDRNGKIYGRMFKKKLQLPDNLREELRKPIGRIVEINKQNVGDGLSVPNVTGKATSPLHRINFNNIILIAVGDIVSQELENNKIISAVKIIDLRSQRKPIRRDVISHVSTMKKIINPPGFIYPRAVQAVHNAILKYYQTKRCQTVAIKGEEDLLTLPAILLAPLGALVIYGQKDVGAIVVEVTEEIKKKITTLIAKFQTVD